MREKKMGRWERTETRCRKTERWMKGETAKETYWRRDPSPLDDPAGQMPVTAVRLSSDIVYCTLNMERAAVGLDQQRR